MKKNYHVKENYDFVQRILGKVLINDYQKYFGEYEMPTELKEEKPKKSNLKKTKGQRLNVIKRYYKPKGRDALVLYSDIDRRIRNDSNNPYDGHFDERDWENRVQAYFSRIINYGDYNDISYNDGEEDFSANPKWLNLVQDYIENYTPQNSKTDFKVDFNETYDKSQFEDDDRSYYIPYADNPFL